METYSTDTDLSVAIRAFRGFVEVLPDDLREAVRPHVLKLVAELRRLTDQNSRLQERVDRLDGLTTRDSERGGSPPGGPPHALPVAA